MEQKQLLAIADVYEAAKMTAVAIAAHHEPSKWKAWAKIVGHMLFPSKSPDDAGKYFSNCLDRDRNEKLDPEQLLWLAREGKRCGCHALMSFICDHCEYAEPVPVEPEDEMAELQRQYINSVKAQEQLIARFERLARERK